MLGHKTLQAFRETGFWTVRKQGVILKAWLVYARFWQCKGGKHQLRLFCRTSTHWIWESQLLRAACPRVGRNARFTESYFLQFVPRLVGLRTYWPWLHLVIMKKKQNKTGRTIVSQHQFHLPSIHARVLIYDQSKFRQDATVRTLRRRGCGTD